jgi:hypothetical protein
MNDAVEVRKGGIHGVWIGALVGAAIAALAAQLLNLDTKTSGWFLHAAGGACVGGLVGFFVGALGREARQPRL